MPAMLGTAGKAPNGTKSLSCFGNRRASALFSILGVSVTACLIIVLLSKELVFRTDPQSAVLSPVPAMLPEGRSSRTCNRMKLPLHYMNGTQGPYNPAAIRLPSTGDWLAFFRIEEVSV